MNSWLVDILYIVILAFCLCDWVEHFRCRDPSSKLHELWD